MAYDVFPLMGFPYETNQPCGPVIYQCFFPDARIAIWKRYKQGYSINLYARTDPIARDTLTDVRDRYNKLQAPIEVEDAFEAQLAINYLMQTYLPTEVSNDFRRSIEAA